VVGRGQQRACPAPAIGTGGDDERGVESSRRSDRDSPTPHPSDVRGSTGLRELRPRAGRSLWRGLYQRVGPEVFVVAAIAPEAQADHRGFARAIAAATTRLGELEDL
jgi:hypothetical protein